jgi:hypothetical protein
MVDEFMLRLAIFDRVEKTRVNTFEIVTVVLWMMENVWGIIRQLIAEAGIVNDCDIFSQDFSCQIFFLRLEERLEA